jgi:transposase
MGQNLSNSQNHTIKQLHKLGWSNRKIAKELGIDRKTVPRHLNTEEDREKDSTQDSKSKCSPYKKIIEEKIAQGLSSQRIYQDLNKEYDFSSGYQSVKRFVNKLKGKEIQVFARRETSPGYEAQVDFGEGALTKKGKGYKKPWLFVMTLGCSRHAYQEVVWHQDVETFIRCHERAFAFFGGVTRVVRLDNLKVGVLKAHLFGPELNPLYDSYAHHAGFTPVPCLPRRPEHKGKVESGVKYTQNNGLKALKFESLQKQNQHLRHWNSSISFTRRHGTTKSIVSEMFEEELPALRPLPTEEFIIFKIGRRRVHPDAHIEVDSAYYSVPHRLITQDVQVRFNSKWVKIYCENQLLAQHPKVQPGSFQTEKKHLPKSKATTEEELLNELLLSCEGVGEHCYSWAKKVKTDRQHLAVRCLLGIQHLKKSYSAEVINIACSNASRIGSVHYHTVKIFCEAQGKDLKNDLLEQHEVIRELSYFSEILDDQENGGD